MIKIKNKNNKPLWLKIPVSTEIINTAKGLIEDQMINLVEEKLEKIIDGAIERVLRKNESLIVIMLEKSIRNSIGTKVYNYFGDESYTLDKLVKKRIDKAIQEAIMNQIEIDVKKVEKSNICDKKD